MYNHCVVVAHSWYRFDSVDEGGSVAKEQVQDVRPSGGELDQLWQADIIAHVHVGLVYCRGVVYTCG